MTPKSYFDDVWQRADTLSALYAFAASNVTSALNPDELLRAEWAMRVSALDLYVHEIVAQYLLEIFRGARPICPGYSKLEISSDTLMNIHQNGHAPASEAAFDLEIRNRLSRVTFQFPNDIADGIRMVSPIVLWNEVAIFHGASANTASQAAAGLKNTLTQIVNRRNKIVHEGDLQPGIPRVPWPISVNDLDQVKQIIEMIVIGIEAKV